ncbi:MAG: FlgD immunoglobulin-like domain containing protein [Candidatus Latescibacterota bacterium]
MKNSMLSLMLLSFFALPFVSNAADSSTIVLDEGTTPVTLSLVNHSNTDLSTVAVSIDQTKLPAWLSIQNTPQTVNIPKGANGQDKILLQFTVTDSPAGAEMIAPLTLRDSYGNVWNSSVHVLTSGLPLQNALYGNYPNPFNPTTTIKYSLKENSKTSLVIYNSLGQKIRTLVDTPQAPGLHTLIWNGKNDRGQQAASGMYFMKLSAGKFTQTKRMMMLE